ncbi:MAG TPA: HEAT repeat domain-containing protein [Pyrinomonadaceae bacterium]|jgi:HEAT repeat protein|nr:HEAT repeat domain-containing protein [Pyrinomonadaceae bacterium]
MRRSFSFGSLLIGLALLGGSACAHPGNAASTPAHLAATETTAAATQSTAQTSTFIQIEGADLKAKLDAAASRARSARTPYWSAYSFDVRPGVAVDPNGGEFHGSMSTSGGTTVFVGSSNGMTVETRNLGIFLLRDSGGALTRMEIYNLDRKREYSGYPVYWMGRANNEESLNYLRGLAEAAPAPTSTTNAGLLNQHATLAIAIHDDARVGAMLKGFAGSSRHPKVRSTAVYWLGQIGGETEFLANIVRNNSETTDVRRQAAHAIGESRDRAALSTLQSLYDGISERDVKRGIIHAVSDNENKEAAHAFLLKVAKTDPDKESRRTAVHAIGEEGRDSVIDDLMSIMSNDQEMDVRRAVLHSLAEIKTPRAQSKILEVARTGNHPDLRRHAIHMLAEVENEAMLGELVKLYDAEQSNDVRRQILHAFSEMKSQQAEDKLFAVARDGAGNADLRRHAIHMIGEKAGKRSLDLLRETVESSSAETQVQVQAVHAISERPAEESVPLLIKIARTHPNQQVRKRAIQVLGESGDPRALEFFREVLRSEKE